MRWKFLTESYKGRGLCFNPFFHCQLIFNYRRGPSIVQKWRNGKIMAKIINFWKQIFFMEKPYFSPNHYQILKNTCLKQHKKLLHGYSKKIFCLCCYSNGAHYHLICILSSPYSYLSRPREAQAEIMSKTELKVCGIEMDRFQTRKPSDFFIFYIKSDRLVSLSLSEKGQVHHYAVLYHILSENSKNIEYVS